MPALSQSLTTQAQALAGTTTHGSGTTVEVYSVTPDVDVRTGMGVTQLNDQGVRIRLPASGTWRIGVEIDLRVRGKVGPFRWSKRLRLRGVVEDLVTEIAFDLDSSNPNLPTISQLHRPRVSFRVTASTNKWYLNLVWLGGSSGVCGCGSRVDGAEGCSTNRPRCSGGPCSYRVGALRQDRKRSRQRGLRSPQDWHLP